MHKKSITMKESHSITINRRSRSATGPNMPLDTLLDLSYPVETITI